MAAWSLHFDMRAPAFGAPAPDLYAAALEMAAWADERGAQAVVLSEHHGEDDGYLPDPLTMAAAIAARTQHVFLSINALVLTLRDPVATAEQALVVDNLSRGRLAITLVPGYVPDEFAMFGEDFTGRVARFEAKVAAFTAALTGEPFEWEGRTVRVTPPPVQRPRPMVFLGGGSRAGARRAARLGDGFQPTTNDAAVLAAYEAECSKLGKVPIAFAPDGPLSVFVADDPDALWATIGPHVLHELRSYGRLADASGLDAAAHPYSGLADVAAARETGVVAVLTPAQAVEHARAGRMLLVKPLIGGLAPEAAWPTLELLVDRVLPELA